MNNSIALLIYFLILLGTGGSKCPKGGSQGNIYLEDSSIQYHVYSETEKVLFENSEGNTKTFTIKENIDSTVMISYSLEWCQEGWADEKSIAYSYRGEFKRVVLASGEDTIQYILTVDEDIRSDKPYFDRFKLSGTISKKSIVPLELITSFRGNEESINYEQKYLYHEERTILNRSFSQVYQSPNNENYFLFKPKIGVVGLVINGVSWVLVK